MSYKTESKISRFDQLQHHSNSTLVILMVVFQEHFVLKEKKKYIKKENTDSNLTQMWRFVSLFIGVKV